MLLAVFVEALCVTRWATRFAYGNRLILERAYDLTVDKFSNLPSGDGSNGQRHTRGPDCRKYFQTFLKLALAATAATGSLNACQEEALSAQVLQSRVTGCFRLSCLEARRAINPTRTRYAWRVGDGVIRLWMPVSMRGGERRAWLARNVTAPNPLENDEHARVQAIVDRRLGVTNCVPLDETAGITFCDGSDASILESLVEEDVNVRGLAEVVAKEKAAGIEQQRPAIQELGRSNLRRLILRIFADLCEGCFEEKQLAASFGLSPATFSRFAGARWKTHPYAPPPDLWINVARTLAGHLTFIQAAKNAGVWSDVEAMVRTGTRPHKEDDHEQ
ncbi:MAG: hypothetical protein NTV86_00900 [Planctomycetota bacterium]|nr:hypothetical protein [Planctomycetota bacterium]